MTRLGLCCIFIKEPIKFRHLRAIDICNLKRKEQLTVISKICLHNAESLRTALHFVRKLEIKAFRILSEIFPLYTHPQCGYEAECLPDWKQISKIFSEIGEFRKKNDIRLSLHPDPFVVLPSPNPKVVENSVKELAYQAFLAEKLDAEVINIHVGGSYGDKKATLARFAENFKRLPNPIKSRLTLENDDSQWTPSELLPFCESLRIPMVYDVHHHRCNPDLLSVEQATKQTIKLWKSFKREPYFHISSPKNGWMAKSQRPHSDYIDFADFPKFWLKIKENITVDVEAKAKELAVAKLAEEINSREKSMSDSIVHF